MRSLAVIWLCLFALSLSAQADVKGYPPGVEEISYISGDQSRQPALFYTPPNQKGPVPLLVALHTWSGNYRQTGGEVVYARWCQQMGWAFIHPNFRGPNYTPDALGSDLAVSDVISSVAYAKTNTLIDPNRIYCIGVSGGGHMSLLMAGRAPELWAGVSAWCGISDIALWYEQCEDSKFSRYSDHITQALGGAPTSMERKESAHRRSPISWLHQARDVNLDIYHGVKDGRIGSVPFVHSLKAWNAVVPEKERFSEEWINQFYETQKSPKAASPDPLLKKNPPLFQKTSGTTRITIFDGGHEIVHEAALNWLRIQERNTPAKWMVENPVKLATESKEQESGK